jgi:transposase
MDSSWFYAARCRVWVRTTQEETVMDSTTIAVDLAKDVFEVVEANAAHRIVSRRRLTRAQFERCLRTQPAGTEIVMESCGMAHHWARECQRAGLRPVLLPVQYVRAYVRRDKNDRTDAEALLEARRCGGILPVPVKTVEQQAVQGLHRIRAQWQATRTARVNGLRGLLREQGVTLRLGVATVRREVPQLLDDPRLPPLLCPVIAHVLEEIRDLERRVADVDRQLRVLSRQLEVPERLQTIPGIGLITATALFGSVPHIHAFRRGRQFASWLGLTPRQRASGHRCWLGRISKRGDVYLRTLLIHGARSVITNATRHPRGHPRPALQQWALTLAARCGVNKAATALANRLARIVWAVWRSDQAFRAMPAVTP